MYSGEVVEDEVVAHNANQTKEEKENESKSISHSGIDDRELMPKLSDLRKSYNIITEIESKVLNDSNIKSEDKKIIQDSLKNKMLEQVNNAINKTPRHFITIRQKLIQMIDGPDEEDIFSHSYENKLPKATDKQTSLKKHVQKLTKDKAVNEPKKIEIQLNWNSPKERDIRSKGNRMLQSVLVPNDKQEIEKALPKPASGGKTQPTIVTNKIKKLQTTNKDAQDKTSNKVTNSHYFIKKSTKKLHDTILKYISRTKDMKRQEKPKSRQNKENKTPNISNNVADVKLSRKDEVIDLTDEALDTKLHKCDICNEIFTYESNLFRHKRIYHGKNVHKNVCSECGKSFARKDYLQRHTNVVHTESLQYVCFCKRVFKDRSNFNRHKKSFCKYLQTEKSFVCDCCKKTFSNIISLQNHIKRMHLEIKKIKQRNFRKFICDYCNQSFYKKARIISHIEEHMASNNLIICKFCDKSLSSLRGLQKHLMMHGGKTYKCNYCDKIFRSSSGRTYHKKVCSKKNLKTIIV